MARGIASFGASEGLPEAGCPTGFGVIEALSANDGNVATTALALGIGRSSLYQLIKTLEIKNFTRV